MDALDGFKVIMVKDPSGNPLAGPFEIKVRYLDDFIAQASSGPYGTPGGSFTEDQCRLKGLKTESSKSRSTGENGGVVYEFAPEFKLEISERTFYSAAVARVLEKKLCAELLEELHEHLASYPGIAVDGFFDSPMTSSIILGLTLGNLPFVRRRLHFIPPFLPATFTNKAIARIEMHLENVRVADGDSAPRSGN